MYVGVCASLCVCVCVFRKVACPYHQASKLTVARHYERLVTMYMQDGCVCVCVCVCLCVCEIVSKT